MSSCTSCTSPATQYIQQLYKKAVSPPDPAEIKNPAQQSPVANTAATSTGVDITI
jgi:hypothetical protein